MDPDPPQVGIVRGSAKLDMRKEEIMQTHKKGLLVILGLIVATSAALAYMNQKTPPPGPLKPIGDGLLTIGAHAAQDKVHIGSDGKLAVALTLAAADRSVGADGPVQPLDLVVVLDRSGSMKGRKIDDARQAVKGLLARLTADDRLAFVVYANQVQMIAPLAAMEDARRRRVAAMVDAIYAGGGTNLGGGLRLGLDTLLKEPVAGRQRKVILISDGLANQGITDPMALAGMAAAAAQNQIGVSTVGVGYDFNEVTMTAIADQGAGRYYFLENPQAFAQVFEQEFQAGRQVAASGVEIRVPQENGVRLVHAAGYPITREGRQAVIHPGDLMAGRQRSLYLTFQVPTDRARVFELGAFQVRYRDGAETHILESGSPLTVACVADPREVMASIDKDVWSGQIMQEEYSQLKERVADAIRSGRKDQALTRIQEYEARNRRINQSVGSAAVARNLEHDVEGLRQSVEETFAGAPAAVAAKQKQAAKTLQYEGYQKRRDKK